MATLRDLVPEAAHVDVLGVERRLRRAGARHAGVRVLPGELLERDVDARDLRREHALDHGVREEVGVRREGDVARREPPVELGDEVEEPRMHERLAPPGERDRLGQLGETIEDAREGLPRHVDLGDLEEREPRAHLAVEVAAVRDLELELVRHARPALEREPRQLPRLPVEPPRFHQLSGPV